MIETVFVVSAQEEFADVKVESQEFCDSCSSRMLCVGKKDKNGIIAVLNPLAAQRGDVVRIEIPEDRYSKELILMFGVLLVASLSGLALIYSLGLLIPFLSSRFSVVGFFVGLIIGGIFLARHYQRIKKTKLYPIITDILKKGESHG